jgi:hypothetical protein
MLPSDISLHATVASEAGTRARREKRAVVDRMLSNGDKHPGTAESRRGRMRITGGVKTGSSSA